MITNDYQDIFLIDFGSSSDFRKSLSVSPLDASTYKVPIYAFSCYYLLGTRQYLDEIKEEKITEPSAIVNFLRIISIDHWGLKLDTFLNSLEALEKAIAD